MKENGNNQNVKEFSLEERIFDFAYEMALRDATLQQSYKGTDKKALRTNNEARQFVNEYIKAVFMGTQPCFYDTERKVENSFRVFIKNKKLTTKKGTLAEFSFGNAQKLINMTAKYMYISAYANDVLRERFQCCHCPMDSIMVERIIDLIDEVSLSDSEDKKITGLLKEHNKSNLTWKQFLRQAWSKITLSDYAQYKLFQGFVMFFAERDGLSAIDFDFKYWSSRND